MAEKKLQTVPTRVVATKRGYFKKLREPGDTFTYPVIKDIGLPTWMAKAEDMPELDVPDEGDEGSGD